MINVCIVEDELEQANLLPYIEKLSSYIASKGKKYKSHYATILNWSRKDINAPDWMNKEIDSNVTDKDVKEMEQILKEIGE